MERTYRQIELLKEHSKLSKLYQWLLSGKPITSWEAIKYFGMTRLSGAIYQLKNTYGIKIDSDLVEFKNEYGTSHFTRYWLVE